MTPEQTENLIQKLNLLKKKTNQKKGMKESSEEILQKQETSTPKENIKQEKTKGFDSTKLYPGTPNNFEKAKNSISPNLSPSIPTSNGLSEAPSPSPVPGTPPNEEKTKNSSFSPPYPSPVPGTPLSQ